MTEEVTLQEPSNPQEAVREDNPAGTPLAVAPGETDAVAPKAEPAPESPVAVGYEVGVRENGEFVFVIKGSKPGLVELLGTHQYAAKKIELLYDKTQVEGSHAVNVQFSILNKKFNQTLETLNELLVKLVGPPPQEKAKEEPAPGKNNI